MHEVTSWVRSNYRTLILAVLCFAGFIVFEAFQQLFYARNFNNGSTPNATFMDVFTGGLHRWTIWLVLALPMVWFSLKWPLKELNLKYLGRYALLIVVMLFLNLTLITFDNIWRFGDLTRDFAPQFEFYFFHKAPMIFVALVFLTILVHFFRKQEELALSISEMGSLKYSNQQLYEQLKSETIRDEAMVIQVKVGNRVKLVPLQSIVWIEADDYCVRIHDEHGKAYTLRSTMKALEEKLPGQTFVRVHRKALVNMTEVREYAFGPKPVIILNNGTEIPLAQSRIKEVRSMLQSVG